MSLTKSTNQPTTRMRASSKSPYVSSRSSYLRLRLAPGSRGIIPLKSLQCALAGCTRRRGLDDDVELDVHVDVDPTSSMSPCMSSRRDVLAIAISAATVAGGGARTPHARADEEVEQQTGLDSEQVPQQDETDSVSSSSASARAKGTVAFSIAVDEEPKGDITFEVSGDGTRAPLAASRVLALGAGIPDGGGGYRGAIVDNVDPAFVRIGQRRLGTLGGAAGAAAAAAVAGGLSGLDVNAEVDKADTFSDFDVLLIAPTALGEEGDYEERLVARNGKLATERNRAKGQPAPPNGTGLLFVLNASALPDELKRDVVRIGRVTNKESQALLLALGNLPRFENNEESGFFQTAKSIGDVRALVAQSAFNRPLSRVKVVKSTAS